MGIRSLINPLLTNPKVSNLFKESYIRARKNSLVYYLYEKMPQQDIIKITSKYSKEPEMFDDLFNGKIKISLHGLSDQPIGLFNKDTVTPDNFKQSIDFKSLIGTAMQLFDFFEPDKKTVNRILIQVKNDMMRIIPFDFNKKAVAMRELNIKILDKENPLVKAAMYADNHQVDLYRD